METDSVGELELQDRPRISGYYLNDLQNTEAYVVVVDPTIPSTAIVGIKECRIASKTLVPGAIITL